MVKIAADQKMISLKLLIEKESEADRRRAFSVIRYTGERISLATLIHPLFALAVVRNVCREVIKKSDVLFVVADVAKVEHQILKIGDEISVTAKKLIVTLTAVLLAALVPET